MEKEKKGLFGKLLDFWQEKSEARNNENIWFWNTRSKTEGKRGYASSKDTEYVENHFAEMGAVASLTQEETKKTFWEEMTEVSQETEMTEKKKQTSEVEEDVLRTKMLFTEEPKTLEEGTKLSEVFLWEPKERLRGFLTETPEGEKEKRKILPVADEIKREEAIAVAEEHYQVTEKIRKEEAAVESSVDIEKLMRQMTKILWEERESCSRRLR